MTQSVINPKAIDAQPITIDHSGDPALQRSGVVLQQQGEPFEFGRECAVMKCIDLLDEVLAGLGRRVLIPNGMKTRCNIAQVHDSGLLVGGAGCYLNNGPLKRPKSATARTSASPRAQRPPRATCWRAQAMPARRHSSPSAPSWTS